MPRYHNSFSEQVKLHIEEVRKLMPLTKRSGLSKSAYLVKYFGVAYDDFRKEVWVSCIIVLQNRNGNFFLFIVILLE